MKQLNLILVIMALATVSQAQDVTIDCREKMMVGLKGGVNFSPAFGTKSEDFHPGFINGFAGGGFINVPINKLIGVQAEILFAQKGFTATGNMMGSSYELTRNTSYIDVPVFFVFMPNQYFSLLAGPQYSYLLWQKNKFAATTNPEQQSEFNADNSRKNSLCFVLGFDVNYKYIVFGARAGWGLEDNNGSGTTITPNYKNMWYQATLGYRFNIRNVCGNDVTRNY